MIPNHTAQLDKLSINAGQAQTLWLQFSFYELLAGSADTALDKLQKAQEADSPCELCDRLLNAYLVVPER